jgi:hypothetical protein
LCDSDLQKRVVFLGDAGGLIKLSMLRSKIFPTPGVWLIAGKEGRTLREHDHRIGYPTVLVDIIEESALMQRPCSVSV